MCHRFYNNLFCGSKYTNRTRRSLFPLHVGVLSCRRPSYIHKTYTTWTTTATRSFLTSAKLKAEVYPLFHCITMFFFPPSYSPVNQKGAGYEKADVRFLAVYELWAYLHSLCRFIKKMDLYASLHRCTKVCLALSPSSSTHHPSTFREFSDGLSVYPLPPIALPPKRWQ